MRLFAFPLSCCVSDPAKQRESRVSKHGNYCNRTQDTVVLLILSLNDSFLVIPDVPSCRAATLRKYKVELHETLVDDNCTYLLMWFLLFAFDQGEDAFTRSLVYGRKIKVRYLHSCSSSSLGVSLLLHIASSHGIKEIFVLCFTKWGWKYSLHGG